MPEPQTTKTFDAGLRDYDALVAEDLFPRLMNDERWKHFWEHRGEDGLCGEKQLLVDFLASSSGGLGYFGSAPGNGVTNWSTLAGAAGALSASAGGRDSGANAA